MTEKETAPCCKEVLKNLSPMLFRALGDPNRVSILAHLAAAGSPQSVTDVTGCCPVDFSVVSRHLKVLKEAGAVSAVKKGKAVYYTVNVTALVGFLRRTADALEACCPGGTCTLEATENV